MPKSSYIDDLADLSHGANCQSTSMRVDPKHSKRSAQITPPSLTCVIEANSLLPIHPHPLRRLTCRSYYTGGGSSVPSLSETHGKWICWPRHRTII